ncbi:MAG: hypothetical protein ABL866_08750 [Devosia sp.]
MPRASLTSDQVAEVRQIHQTMVERLGQAGPRRRFAYRLQAVILLPLIWLLGALPVDIASGFGGWLGRTILAPLLNFPKHKRTVRVPFPHLDDAGIKSLLAEMSENIGRVLAEVPHLRDFAGPGNLRIRLTGIQNVEAARAMGAGVLFVTGHFGNWEMSEVAIRNAGLDGVVVVDHPKNPHFTARLALMRLGAGLSEQVGTRLGVYRTLRRRLKAGSIALMLVDQRVSNGIKVPFFGLETITNVIPARIARTLGTPVVPMSVRRLEGAHFEVRFESPLLFTSSGDEPADERTFMRRINAYFESELLRMPAHWLWGHPRWDDVFLGIAPKRAPKSSDSG